MLELERPANSSTNKELTLMVSQLISTVNGQDQIIQSIQDQLNQPASIPTSSTPQAVNQIRNGSYSHSTGSWANSATADNRRYECAWWYSHPNLDGQPMYKETTVTGNAVVYYNPVDVDTGTDEIRIPNHGLDTGLGVRFSLTGGGGTLASPFVVNTTYYVIRVDGSTIQLATTVANAVAGTAINITTQGVNTQVIDFNYTLKEDSDTYYSSVFSNWDWVTGSACLQGSKTLDALIPGNNVEAGYNFYAQFDCARANQYVTADPAVRITAGIYAHSTAQGWEWLWGAFTITADVIFDGTLHPTSRDYVIHATTDRGFTIQSSVLTVASAPSDDDFTNGARVVLSWKQALNYGIQSYEVYRNTAGTYKLLYRITTGILTYIDNNSVQADAAGYPSYTFNQLVAYTSTIPNVLATIPYAGDPNSPQWASVPFAIRIPQNYNMSDTILAGGQWLRWGYEGNPNANGNLDIEVHDATVTLAVTTVTTTSSGQFRADQVGLDIDIIAKDGTVFSSVIGSYTNANEIEMLDPYGNITAENRTVYIHGGANEHSVYFDLSHLTYIQGAAFAPNPEDISPSRGLPPVTPNGTTQGGSGTGQLPGRVDGQPLCLFEDEIVLTKEGEVAAKDLQLGTWLPDGHGGFNKIKEISYGVDDIFLIETVNGIALKATATKSVYTPTGKKTISQLRKGDIILTYDNGKLLESAIFLKEVIMKKRLVVQLKLLPNHSFLAGTGNPTGYILVDNSKPVQIDGGNQPQL